MSKGDTVRRWKDEGKPMVPCQRLRCVSNDGEGTCVEWWFLSEPRSCSQRTIKEPAPKVQP